MKIKEHFNKNNLHHAYLIEGDREQILGEVLEFVKSLGIKVSGNADVIDMSLDSFKVEDARNLKSYAGEMGFSDAKKIFIISANNFLLEAQNSLLKIFEEPTENTHFFIITPDANSFLKTLLSRCYFIRAESADAEALKEAEKFIAMPARNRVEYIKELLTVEEKEDEEGNEIISLNSPRSKALKFLNTLEEVLHRNHTDQNSLANCFPHFFKVREFLRQSGSPTKTLMESVALVIPEK